MKGPACAIIVALSMSSMPVANAASPAVSRGEELLSVSFGECIARARSAFEAEGWRIGEVVDTSYLLGRKDIHTAYITCSPAPPDEANKHKVWANIFVASTADDGAVPGAERTKLQLRMAQASPVTSFHGRWSVTRWGAFDVEQDGAFVRGRMTSPSGTFSGSVYGDVALVDYREDTGAVGRMWFRLGTATAIAGRWCAGPTCDPKVAATTFSGKR